MVIAAQRLRASIRGRHVLDGVDLHLVAGSRCNISATEPEDAGTLLRVLATLHPLDGGRLTIAGLEAATEPARIRRHLFYVAADPALPQGLTAGEFVTFVAATRDVRLTRRDAASLLHAHGIQPGADATHLPLETRRTLSCIAARAAQVDLLLIEGGAPDLAVDATGPVPCTITTAPAMGGTGTRLRLHNGRLQAVAGPAANEAQP